MFQRIVIFLVGTAIDLLTFLLLARLLMQWFRVSFANPIGEFVIALTNWLVRPLRRVVPGVLGIDLASFLPAWVLQTVLVLAIAWLGQPALLADGGLFFGALLVGLIDTLRVAIYVLIVALIGAAIISWVNPYSPLAGPVMQMSRPMLRPVQRLIRPIGNIDLSPLVVIVLLQVVLIVLDGLRGR